MERHRVFRRQGELGIVPDRTLLAPRNPGVRPWSELSNDERRFAARLQEAFAAFLDHADSCVGRLIEYLRDTGELDNTLFLVLSDNGASQEGGETGLLAEMKYFAGFTEDAASAVGRLEDIGTERSHSNYPWGWAMAGNTPLRWYKQNTHGGGVRVPLIVHWPAGITDYGANRDQFCYVTDIVPTVLDILGAEPPGELNGVLQQTLHGTSLQPSFAAGHTTRRTRTQYFEMLGHRGLYHAGWKAVTRHDEGTDFESDRWELYHLDTDFSETKDLAAEHPAKLRSSLSDGGPRRVASGSSHSTIVTVCGHMATHGSAASSHPGASTCTGRHCHTSPSQDALPTASAGSPSLPMRTSQEVSSRASCSTAARRAEDTPSSPSTVG